MEELKPSFSPRKKGGVGAFQVKCQVQGIGEKNPNQIQVESPMWLKSDLIASCVTQVPIFAYKFLVETHLFWINRFFPLETAWKNPLAFNIRANKTHQFMK